METKIWLSSPHMGGDEISYINQAFTQNWIAPLGPNVTGFEQDLQQYLNVNDKNVGALASGTSALHLALILAGVKNDDEVICQSLTFSASANPIVYQGAIPIFVDSEPDTFNICPIALEQAIQDRITKGKTPKAVIAVHLYGMPFKATQIIEICKKYNICLIEDAAEALGSTYKNIKCGTFGDYAALSFNGNKIITTSGGGAIVANNDEVKKAIFLATQARDNAPHYQHSQIGYNYRLSNICAGIGRGQMKVLDSHIEARRQMNSFYRNLFKDIEGITFQNEPTTDFFSNYWLTAIVVDQEKLGKTAEDLRLALEKANIESRPLWKPMHLQPVFEKYPYYGEQVAEKLFLSGLCLPSGSNLSNEDRERIATVITEFLN